MKYIGKSSISEVIYSFCMTEDERQYFIKILGDRVPALFNLKQGNILELKKKDVILLIICCKNEKWKKELERIYYDFT